MNVGFFFYITNIDENLYNTDCTSNDRERFPKIVLEDTQLNGAFG